MPPYLLTAEELAHRIVSLIPMVELGAATNTYDVLAVYGKQFEAKHPHQTTQYGLRTAYPPLTSHPLPIPAPIPIPLPNNPLPPRPQHARSFATYATPAPAETSAETEWPMNKVRTTFIEFFEKKHAHTFWKTSPVAPLVIFLPSLHPHAIRFSIT